MTLSGATLSMDPYSYGLTTRYRDEPSGTPNIGTGAESVTLKWTVCLRASCEAEKIHLASCWNGTRLADRRHRTDAGKNPARRLHHRQYLRGRRAHLRGIPARPQRARLRRRANHPARGPLGGRAL